MYVRGAPVSKMKCAATLRPRADTGKVTSTRLTKGHQADHVDFCKPGNIFLSREEGQQSSQWHKIGRQKPE